MGRFADAGHQRRARQQGTLMHTFFERRMLGCQHLQLNRRGCVSANEVRMTKLKYIYWQDDNMWLGYLDEYPDYMTQGETLDDLQEHLRDIYQELGSGTIPSVRHVGELAVA